MSAQTAIPAVAPAITWMPGDPHSTTALREAIDPFFGTLLDRVEIRPPHVIPLTLPLATLSDVASDPDLSGGVRLRIETHRGRAHGSLGFLLPGPFRVVVDSSEDPSGSTVRRLLVFTGASPLVGQAALLTAYMMTV